MEAVDLSVLDVGKKCHKCGDTLLLSEEMEGQTEHTRCGQCMSCDRECQGVMCAECAAVLAHG